MAEIEKAPCGARVDKFITSTYQGIAISTAREIAFLVSGDVDSLIENVEKRTLGRVFLKIIDGIKQNSMKPYMVFDENGVPKEFSYIPTLLPPQFFLLSLLLRKFESQSLCRFLF